MTIQEAMNLLSTCDRQLLINSILEQISLWFKNGSIIAVGRFESRLDNEDQVRIYATPSTSFNFRGEEANKLRQCRARELKPLQTP